MHYRFIKRLLFLIFIIFSACTEILLNDDQYNSVYLSGGGWIQYNSSDLDVLDGNFSIQLWVAGNDTEISNDAKALITILNNGGVVLGLFRDTSLNNVINVYLNNELSGTIQSDDLDWTTSNFNLITLSSENDVIKIYVNKEEFNVSNFDLEINLSDLIIGAKVNVNQ